jgi:hypothetical protein
MKVNKIFAIAALISIASASSALAAASTVVNAVGSDLVIAGSPAVTVKPSKNVLVKYTPGAAASAGAATYGIQSHHVSGTKSYASSSGDTKIFMMDDNSTTAITATLTAPAVGASMDSSGYTAM